MIKENLLDYIENSIRKNWNIPAVSDYKGKTYNYSEVARQIVKFHILFEESGIKEGDKIALIGNNTANWAVIYLAIVTYGAVIVPVLSDFKPEDIHQIVAHSDSKILFVSDPIWSNLKIENIKNIEAVISIENFDILYTGSESFKNAYSKQDELFKRKYVDGLNPENFHFKEIKNSELALIFSYLKFIIPCLVSVNLWLISTYLSVYIY